MPTNRDAVAGASSRQRSRVDNAPHFVRGLDGRSAQARRFKSLIKAFSEGIGGNLDATQIVLVRQAALSVATLEAMQEAMARGETVDVEQLVRLQNVAARALKALPRKAPAKADRPRNLREALAR